MRDVLTGILDEAFQARPTEEWLSILAGHVPAAPIRSPREALFDPELEAAGGIEALDLRGRNGSFRVLASPIRTGGKPSRGRACPPLGADTREILRGAGYSDIEIQTLEDEGII